MKYSNKDLKEPSTLNGVCLKVMQGESITTTGEAHLFLSSALKRMDFSNFKTATCGEDFITSYNKKK